MFSALISNIRFDYFILPFMSYIGNWSADCGQSNLLDNQMLPWSYTIYIDNWCEVLKSKAC